MATSCCEGAAVAGHPGNYADKVGHKARDVALEQSIVADDDVLVEDLGLVELVAH